MPEASEQGREATREPSGSRLRGALAPTALVTLLCAGLLPFMGFMNTNSQRSFDVGRLVVWALATTVVVVLVDLALVGLLRRAAPARVAVAWAVLVSSFFLFSAWLSPRPETDALRLRQWGAWTLATAILVGVAYRLSAKPLVRQWFAATLAIMCVVNLAGYLLAAPPGTGGGGADSDSADAVSPDDLVRDPNVYLILLDSYARNDVLEDVYGLDNAGFHQDLEARGFEVAERSLTSYPITALSTMALFEMGYPADEPPDFAGNPLEFSRYIQGDNATVERFGQLGYTYVYAPGGPFEFASCTTRFADVCISPDSGGSGLGEQEIALIDLTPLGPLRLVEAPRTDPLTVVDELIAADLDEPYFAFAHIISPHPPYFYDEDCDRRTPLLSEREDSPEQRAAVVTEIECLNRDVLEAVDRILADDPDAVIVLLSDHGTELFADWGAPLAGWSDEMLRERFGVQNALRLPEPCQGDVGPDTPIVADMSLVFACLEGREPDPPEFRAFLWLHDDPHTIEAIPPERLGVDG